MANTYAPNGFQQVNQFQGYAPNYALTTRRIASTNTNKIGYGDPVKSLTTGYIDVATVTQQIMGIFYGCQYYDTARTDGTGWQFSRQWTGVTTASADPVAFVCQDPTAIFQVQCSGTSGVTTAQVGLNINFTAAGAPSTLGFSVAAADTSSAATMSTTNTLPFRIIGLTEEYMLNYSTTGANNYILVRLNNCDANTTTGI